MTLQSLPTIEQANLDKYWDIVRQLDPEFYLIKIALQETGFNPTIVPKIIRALSNLAIGTGYGKVEIFMIQKKITQIKPQESIQVNEDVVKP